MKANNPIPASFSTSDGDIGTAPNGGRAHQSLIAHTERLVLRTWKVRDGVWCVVGNGLSNQTFVEGPEGLIAIDTGESIEEMTAALEMIRAETKAPVAAVIYSHFHYTSGTKALFDVPDVPIWGHTRIEQNLGQAGTELSAVGARGLIHQFGIALPDEGEDALVNSGLGIGYRNKSHSPFTPGFIPPTHTFDSPTTTTLAGLRVELTPAPSDADDSVTIWFPELGVCVHNIVWPALFNVFAIRGEEYRDPRVLLAGIDHVLGLGAEHLVASHGPPMSGTEPIRKEVTDYRDSIQYLWDQTVRGINKGLTVDELSEFVQLPDRFGRSFLTQQHYGLAEHHVKQIYTGLRGWFDGDESRLLPTPPVEKARRMIEGFGGTEEVRRQAREAVDDLDLRWALELSSWLVHCEEDDDGRADGGTAGDRQLLAFVLREVAQRTTSANVRNWSLTRALELEGRLDMDRHRVHRFSTGIVLNAPLKSLHALRVLLDPIKAAGRHQHLLVELGGVTGGMMLRDGVAIPTDGSGADFSASMDVATWAAIMASKAKLSDQLGSGAVRTDHPDDVAAFFACFDHAGLSA
ncbi:MAG: MBL fold metallo-hydrolase [Actinomycetia bacterium]|nr:MBL fold metallo-hydrolase [Actinomycetes bacterium]